MPDLIQNKQRRSEFKNYSANFLNIHLITRAWPLVTLSVWSTKNHLGGKCFADDEEVEMEVQKWLRQQSKDFYAECSDTLVKQWDKCIQCYWRNVKKYMFFPGPKFTCFTFYIHLWVIYWLSLVCMLYIQSFTMPNIIPCLENLGALTSHNPMYLQSLLQG
jgi:hypothetical protein